MTQLANISSPRLSSYDLVDSVLKSLQVNRNNEKALSLLAAITKNIDDDIQVIAILRIASKLIDSTDNHCNKFPKISKGKRLIDYRKCQQKHLKHTVHTHYACYAISYRPSVLQGEKHL